MKSADGASLEGLRGAIAEGFTAEAFKVVCGIGGESLPENGGEVRPVDSLLAVCEDSAQRGVSSDATQLGIEESDAHGSVLEAEVQRFLGKCGVLLGKIPRRWGARRCVGRFHVNWATGAAQRE